MSVPRPTPTSLAKLVTTDGKRIDQAARAAKTSSPRRRTAWVRAPRPRSSRTATTTTATMRTSWIATIFTGGAFRGLAAGLSSQHQVGQDVDGVPERLTLGLRVVGVEDVHGVLHIDGLGCPDLGDKLAGVCHPVLGDVELCDHPTAYRTQPVVGVREAGVRGQVGVSHGRPEHHLLREVRLGAVIHET